MTVPRCMTEAGELARDYGNSFLIWEQAGRWDPYCRDAVSRPSAAGSAAELRQQLDRALVKALPRLREQVREAEAAAARVLAGNGRTAHRKGGA